MNQESKEVDPAVDEAAIKEVADLAEAKISDNDEVNEDEDEDPEVTSTDAVAERSAAKKKKSKRAKLKKALGVSGKEDGDASGSKPASKLTQAHVEQLLEMNPSLKGEVAGMDNEKAAEALKKLDVSDLLTGMVCSIILTSKECQLILEQSVSGKNQKDMASYKFWQTQPVPRFGQSMAYLQWV